MKIVERIDELHLESAEAKREFGTKINQAQFLFEQALADNWPAIRAVLLAAEALNGVSCDPDNNYEERDHLSTALDVLGRL